MIRRVQNRCKHQLFEWVAEHKDEVITEFMDGVKVDINKAIDRDKLVRFGIVGAGERHWLECYRGTLNLLGDPVSIQIVKNGEIYRVTGQNKEYTDVFSLKEGYADVDLAGGSIDQGISAYLFGFNTEVPTPDGEVLVRVMVIKTKDVGIEIRLQNKSDIEIDGVLINRSGKSCKVHEQYGEYYTRIY